MNGFMIFGFFLPLLVNSPTVTSIQLRVGEVIDANKFPHASSALNTWLASIDTMKIGQHTQTFTVHEQTVTYQIEVSLEHTFVTEQTGDHPFITSFDIADHGHIALYNPSAVDVRLEDYALIINQTSYVFNPELVLPTLSAVTIAIQQGVPIIGTIDIDHPIVIQDPVEVIHLWERERMIDIDSIPVADTIVTRFGDVTSHNHIFYREAYVTGPDSIYQFNQWYALDDTIPYTEFTPMSPLAPLHQAKAWTTDVMFGSGMFASGRVEEAFRALESEYGFMNEVSQLLLFSEPNTEISGINERGNFDRSTFREAVGRYNYLAARVPGATGLINPNPTPFPVVTVVTIGGALVGLFAIYALIKSRYQRV